MKRSGPLIAIFVAVAFAAGFFSHLLYRRWNRPISEPRSHPVTYAALPPSPPVQVELPMLEARDVEKIRFLAGSRAKVRGRVFRVGHAAKSDTYFLNFGPSRSSFTAVIFASAVELFEKRRLAPQSLEGKEIEIAGEIKDHPQFGLEMILEDPAQLKILD